MGPGRAAEFRVLVSNAFSADRYDEIVGIAARGFATDKSSNAKSKQCEIGATETGAPPSHGHRSAVASARWRIAPPNVCYVPRCRIRGRRDLRFSNWRGDCCVKLHIDIATEVPVTRRRTNVTDGQV